MTVDMRITDYQHRIVWLIGANDQQKATYQITQHHVRMLLTATVPTEASVVYCTYRYLWSNLKWPAVLYLASSVTF